MLKSLFPSKNISSDYRLFLIKWGILIVTILVLFVAYAIIHVIIAFLLAAFFVMLFSPFLNWCNRHRIPDWLGILMIYLIGLGLITLIFVSIIPIFVDQISRLIHGITSWFATLESSYKQGGVDALGLPMFLRDYVRDLDWHDLFSFLRANIGSIGTTMSANLKNIASGGAGVISSVGNAVFSIITIFVFAFFMAIERREIKNFFYRILPLSISKYISSREDDVMSRLSSWMRGQFILSGCMSMLVYVGLWILHAFGIVIENKATLALLAGLLESIPYFGPILALLPAVALASAGGWISIVATILLYICLQQLEGQVLIPIIMSKSLDLSPFFVLIMMAIGASVAGILGIFLAVPCAAIIEIGVRDFLSYKSQHKF